MKLVALAVASTFFALMTAEGVIRLLHLAPEVRAVEVSEPNSLYRWSENPTLGYELQPGVPGVNSFGQRDVERTLVKQTGVRRILVLGDSVAEGFDVDRVDDTLTRQLERLCTDGKTEVLNFGVGGYCTRGEVELLKTKGLAFHPDIVIVVFVINDWENFNGEVGLFMTPSRPRIVNQAFRMSHLFRMTCLGLNLFGFSASADPARRNVDAIGRDNVVEGLRLLKELSIEHGFQPLLAVWPVFTDDRVLDPQVAKGTNQLMIEVLAAREGIPTYRVSEYFQNVQQGSRSERTVNPRRTFTIGDGMHPNVEGSRVGAEALKAMLDHGPAGPPKDSSAVKLNLTEAELRAAIDGVAGVQKSYAYEDALLHAAQMASDSPAEALSYYRAALQLKPMNANVCYFIGYKLANMGQLEDALAACRRALSLEPGNADAHNMMGFVLVRMGRRGEALEEFQKAIGLEPTHVDALVNAGTLILQEGKIEEARVLMSRALSSKPGDPGAIRGLQAVEQAVNKRAQPSDPR